ncbi:GldG family protein [Fulvivirgaceae bacterium BMA10]|uniref:GldG family protein n=1 Tax=Splendidivirga corallicola TaxID=3051826 RepID=A0ABT8KSN4_9BACT|nr:GldG family protein [Fulvivirgaceae bacterium BMA10]
MNRGNILLRLVVVLAIILVINLIAHKAFFRLDFTADDRYTLSKATKDVLGDLEDVVTITAYFSEDLPAQLQSTRKDFEDLLVEYENRSDANVVYEFKNPNESEASERAAQEQGIAPISIQVRERDQAKQLRAYMGATLQMGESIEVISAVQVGARMEYEITSAIKKLSVTDKPKVALIQGHGEATLAAVPQLAQQLSILYDFEAYTINDSTEIPTYYRAIAMIDPKDTISVDDLNKLDNYLKTGGGIFLAYSNYSGGLNTQYLQPAPNIGLKSWLSQKGIVPGEQLVTDVKSASISVPQRQGPFTFTTNVQVPYIPIIGTFEDHPVSNGIESLVLPISNNITFTSSDSAVNVTSLAFTSEQSGAENLPVFIDINREWRENDFTEGEQTVAVALDGVDNGKIVFVSNGNFPVNGEPSQQQQQVNQDNVNFVANAIDWIADDTGLNELRTKGITQRPLKPLEAGDRDLIKLINVVLPVLLLLAYAFFRRQANLKKRQRWLQGDYS